MALACLVLYQRHLKVRDEGSNRIHLKISPNFLLPAISGTWTFPTPSPPNSASLFFARTPPRGTRENKHWSKRKSQECNAHSGGHWFTDCNSQRLSRFAAPFIAALAHRSVPQILSAFTNGPGGPGARTLPGARMLLVAPGHTTRSKDATSVLQPSS